MIVAKVYYTCLQNNKPIIFIKTNKGDKPNKKLEWHTGQKA